MEKLLFCYLIMYVFMITLLMLDNYSSIDMKLLNAYDVPVFLPIVFYVISLITPIVIIRIDNSLIDLFLFKSPFHILYIITLIYSLIFIFIGYMKLGAAYCCPQGRAQAAETIFIHFNLLVTSSTLLIVCYYDLIQSKTTILILLLILLEILNIVIGILKNNELFDNIFNPLGISKYILLVLFFKSKSIKEIPIAFNNSYIIFFILLLISTLFILNNKSKINEYTHKKKYYNFFALKTYKDMLENPSVSYNINDILKESYSYSMIYQHEKDSDDYKHFYLPYERKDDLLDSKYNISYKLKDVALEYSNKIYSIMNKNSLNVEITIFLLILFLLSI